MCVGRFALGHGLLANLIRCMNIDICMHRAASGVRVDCNVNTVHIRIYTYRVTRHSIRQVQCEPRTLDQGPIYIRLLVVLRVHIHSSTSFLYQADVDFRPHLVRTAITYEKETSNVIAVRHQRMSASPAMPSIVFFRSLPLYLSVVTLNNLLSKSGKVALPVNHFPKVRLSEDCQSVSSNVATLARCSTFDKVRYRSELTLGDDFESFSCLEGEAILWDVYFGHLARAGVNIKSSSRVRRR